MLFLQSTLQNRSLLIPISPRRAAVPSLPRHLSLGSTRERHYLFSSTMADEELADPKKYLEDSCKPKCARPLHAYQACVRRIKGDESGHKHCTGQYFDYFSCVDNCVAPKLFPKLK
ncbi:unnamed protein product [Musa hybrid cultivar]